MEREKYGDVKKEDENKESNYGSSYNRPVLLPSSDDNRQLTVDDVLDYIGFGPFQVRKAKRRCMHRSHDYIYPLLVYSAAMVRV